MNPLESEAVNTYESTLMHIRIWLCTTAYGCNFLILYNHGNPNPRPGLQLHIQIIARKYVCVCCIAKIQRPGGGGGGGGGVPAFLAELAPSTHSTHPPTPSVDHTLHQEHRGGVPRGS